MKNFENLGGKLSKNEQRNILGGLEDGGRCIGLYCLDNGYESCWYTSSGTVSSLCASVYPNCQLCSGGSVPCNGCTMN